MSIISAPPFINSANSYRRIVLIQNGPLGIPNAVFHTAYNATKNIVVEVDYQDGPNKQVWPMGFCFHFVISIYYPIDTGCTGYQFLV